MGLEAGRPSHPKSQGADLCQRAEMVLETSAQAKAQQQEGLGRLLGSLENQALPTLELQWAQTKQNWRREGRENNSLSQNYMSPWNSGVLALSTPQGKIHLRSFKWAHASLGPSLSARVKPVSLEQRSFHIPALTPRLPRTGEVQVCLGSSQARKVSRAEEQASPEY